MHLGVDRLNVSQQMCPHGKAASRTTGCASRAVPAGRGRCGHPLQISTGDTHLEPCVSAGLPRTRQMWMYWRVSSKGPGRYPRDFMYKGMLRELGFSLENRTLKETLSM